MEDWKLHKEMAIYYSDTGVKRSKYPPDNNISTHKVAAQRMLGTALEKEGGEPSLLQIIERRIVSIRFKGKQDFSDLSGHDEKLVVKKLFMKNHKKIWDQAKLWTRYNTVRKDPDSLMELSSIFLKKPGLSRSDIKKVLLLQDGRGDVRSWIKVVKPEVSGNCRKGCDKSESA